MNEVMLENAKLELKRGDIAGQDDIEAVVNAANAELKMGGGVAGAIHRAAGPGLAEETAPLAPIEPGEAVITGGHELPNEYVIHCLGPVYGKDKPGDELLANCYVNALERAEEKGIRSVAFPSISTGAFGYPMKEAARVAFSAIREKDSELSEVGLIRFVLYGEEAMKVHEEVLEEMFGS